jgi:ParB-like chromosome segregation protein Spo0J
LNLSTDFFNIQMSVETISIEELDRTDRRFAVSYPGEADERLIASINAVGIIQPLVVLGKDLLVVVCGFKRLAAALSLAMRKVPVIFFAGSEREALLAAIHDNLERGYNMVEKALCLSKMEKAGWTIQESLKIIPLLSLEPHEKVLRSMVRLGSTTEVVKDFVLRRKLSLKSINLLLSFEEPDRSALAGLLSNLHTTESFVREILELFLLMKARKVSVGAGQYEGIKTAALLKEALKRVTNPLLGALEQKLVELKAQCRLPPGLDIKVDPFFEKEYIDILVRIRSELEGQALVDKLLLLFREGQIGRILELTRS